jgi:ribosomal-protein-serine acetyltransferase
MQTVLTDGTIKIRRYKPEDVDAVYEAASESLKELSPWLMSFHANYSKNETNHWINSRDEAWAMGADHDMAIVDAATDEYLGGSGVIRVNQDNLRGEVGYWVRTSRAGHGIALAAARLSARFGFEELGLQRVELIIAVRNARSQRVAEKLGAKREGIHRNYLRLNGVQQDAIYYSLIPGDI